MAGMDEYVSAQAKEALGQLNRYFAGLFYGREVTDPDQLLEYYIKHGGASDFAVRWRKEHETAASGFRTA